MLEEHICQQSNMINIRCLLPNWIFTIIAIIIAIIIYRHSYTLRVNTCPVFILFHCQFAKLRQIKWNETILRFLLKKLTQPLGKPSAAVPILPYLVGYTKRTNHDPHHSSVTLVYLGYTSLLCVYRKLREDFKDTFASLLHYLQLLDLDHLLDMIKQRQTN